MSGTIQLRDLQTGKIYDLPIGGGFLVGRTDPHSRADWQITDPYVSRRHCELHVRRDASLQIVDFSSSGTYVNGARLQGQGVARPGDTIRFGTQYQALLVGADEPATLAGPGGPAPEVPIGAVGTCLDERYQLIREIGRGGMGVVLQAYDQQLDRSCAVKFLQLAAGSVPAERFQREARVATLLGDHPNIVKVYDYGSHEQEGFLYLVMDYVEGPHLGHLASGGVSRVDGVRLVLATARAVAFAHRQGIFHRDLKPENVLVAPGGDVRLTDFGIAKTSESQLTGTGDVMGTPSYVPPEQLEDSKHIGPQADVYGLGGILYCVLTGRPPYEGDQLGQILKKVALGQLEPPSTYARGLDPALERVCLKALATDPEERQPDPAAFAADLEAWLAGQGA